MIYRNRFEAAKYLCSHLSEYKDRDDVIVLALPRGGVPMGLQLASCLNCAFDVLLVKKIGHPFHAELAIGAVTPEDYYLDQRFRDVPQDYIQEKVDSIRKLLILRKFQYRGNVPDPPFTGITLIILDDGIATGQTIQAAIQLVRRKNPAKIILAVPVAPHGTMRKFSSFVDEIICLQEPEDFFGVGQYYEDFSPVEDDEIIDLLKKFRSRGGGKALYYPAREKEY